eukprot:gnl/TRDRNA2_/TRDRNA2_175627_c0_seq1.p1 gnl/TRDRNA2_/TRDRNA2_175627_c0~~gnl/TRDRNA2_/TRDRNA2_175627_c0_seq1.p1  ORF type:complete len:402 (+),score=24.95 gnl/TRDRNA2_/TRDRNA2_175627_c0_seq1:77-1282(+)
MRIVAVLCILLSLLSISLLSNHAAADLADEYNTKSTGIESADESCLLRIPNVTAIDYEQLWHMIDSETLQVGKILLKRQMGDWEAWQPGQSCNALTRCNRTCFARVAYDRAGTKQLKIKVFEKDVYVGRAALCTGHVWERKEVQRAISRLTSAKVGNFLDIGANIGSYSLPVAATMRDFESSLPATQSNARKVVAVEASPTTASLLNDSIRANNLSDTISLHVAAINRNASRTSLCSCGSEDNPGGQQTVTHPCREFSPGILDKRCQITPGITLDQLYDENPATMQRILLAKLDCEGCEGQALMGARHFLKQHPPCYLMFEVTEQYLCDAGTPLSELSTFLRGVGYDTQKLQAMIHGDGTCEGYIAWVMADPQNHNPFVQNFAQLQQVDLDQCIRRIRDSK